MKVRAYSKKEQRALIAAVRKLAASGQMSITKACAQLGVKESNFYNFVRRLEGVAVTHSRLLVPIKTKLALVQQVEKYAELHGANYSLSTWPADEPYSAATCLCSTKSSTRKTWCISTEKKLLRARTKPS